MKNTADQKARRLVKARKEHDRDLLRKERTRIANSIQAVIDDCSYDDSYSLDFIKGLEYAINMINISRN